MFPYLSQFTGWYWFPRCKGSNHFSFHGLRMPQKPLVAHRQPSWCRRSMKKWSRPMLDLSTLAVKEVQNWYGLLRYMTRCYSRIGTTLFDFDRNTSWFLGFSFHLLLECSCPFPCTLGIRNLVWKCFDWWTKWLEPFVEARCCFRCQPHLNPRYSCTLEFLNQKKRRKSDSSCPLLSTIVHPFVAMFKVFSNINGINTSYLVRQPLDVFLSWHFVSPFELLFWGWSSLPPWKWMCAPIYWCPLCFYSIWVHFCVTTSMLCGSRFRISPPWDRGRFSHSRDATRVGFSLWTLHHAAGGALEGHGGSLGSGHHVAINEHVWTCPWIGTSAELRNIMEYPISMFECQRIYPLVI